MVILGLELAQQDTQRLILIERLCGGCGNAAGGVSGVVKWQQAWGM